MTISVLMSVYRSEQPDHLDQALHSVWTQQTRKPDQIVLIKDGPLDPPVEAVIADWGRRLGTQLTLHQNAQNVGLTRSLNTGIALATSELIARMDSDDLSTPRRFELQHAFLQAHPDVDIVGGSMQEFSQTESCINVRHYPPTHADAVRMIAKASPLAHPTVMMRRSLFTRGGLRYDERYRTSQDIALWFDAICAGYHIGNVPEVTLLFRRDNDVFRRRSRAKAWNEFRIYMGGIRRLHGLLTLKYIFPLARLAFRLMPRSLIKAIYSSPLRQKVVEAKPAADTQVPTATSAKAQPTDAAGNPS